MGTARSRNIITIDGDEGTLEIIGWKKPNARHVFKFSRVDASTILAHRWGVNVAEHRVYPIAVSGDRGKVKTSLSRFMTGPTLKTLFINGDQFDYRRENITTVNDRDSRYFKGEQRKPYVYECQSCKREGRWYAQAYQPTPSKWKKIGRAATREAAQQLRDDWLAMNPEWT